MSGHTCPQSDAPIKPQLFSCSAVLRPYFNSPTSNPCVFVCLFVCLFVGSSQEWLWCLGFFLRARLHFAKEVKCKNVLMQTMTSVKKIVARHNVEISNSPWRSLPELTNAGGSPCCDGCPAQAWSVGCLLDVLYDMEKVIKAA